jgi:hypothetical protein
MLLRGFPLGASEGLRHSDEVVTFGLCDEPGKREQLATSLLGQAGEVRAIRFDCSQHSYARTQVVF